VETLKESFKVKINAKHEEKLAALTGLEATSKKAIKAISDIDSQWSNCLQLSEAHYMYVLHNFCILYVFKN
jgi:hypothetical protein